MPDSRYNEKRKYSRVEAKIKVAFKTIADLKVEYTRNISAGGMFLKTNQLLDPNAEIALTLHLPENMGKVAIKGKVIRLMSMTHPDDENKQVYGVGIRFVELSQVIKEKIEKVIEVHQQADAS